MTRSVELSALDLRYESYRMRNPAVEAQAVDRTHRIGQTRAMQVHRLLTEGTIEHRIGLLLDTAKPLAAGVHGDQHPAGLAAQPVVILAFNAAQSFVVHPDIAQDLGG